MNYFYEAEDRDGVRFSWNIWPPNKDEAVNNIVPLGCMYTPLKNYGKVANVNYEPLVCKAPCTAVLNPHCLIDLNSRVWTCPFCDQRNPFPQTYQHMSVENMPLEVHPTMTTIEYTLNSARLSPAIVLVVDICLSDEDMQSLKDSLLGLLDVIPPTSYIGLVTFGRVVYVHQLGVNRKNCDRVYVFEGENEVSTREIHKMLGVGKAINNGRIQADPRNDFIVPYNKNQVNIENALEDIYSDRFKVEKLSRPKRCTGVALSVAIGLLENTFSGVAGRIMMFMGGPVSSGPGAIIGTELKQSIRTHNELRSESVPYMHKATKFYESMSERATANGHVVDLFSCSMNQTGLLEMRRLCSQTGGIMVLADGFDAPVFQKTLSKMFEKDETRGVCKMAFTGVMEVIVSSPALVSGCIGGVSVLPNVGFNVSDDPIGVGKNAWKVCGLDPFSTFAIFFELQANKGSVSLGSRNRVMIQFRVSYRLSSGIRIQRVTTVSHTMLNEVGRIPQMLQGFDQECAAAMITRLAVFKNERDDYDALVFIDQHLIGMMKRFCTFEMDLPSSVQIPEEMSLYAQFMYYLRRGPLIQVFNNTPDESVFFRYCLERECVNNILIMIQPTLDSYTLDSDPVPVFLSANSITQNNILLLDTFFHIVIHTGSIIAQWRDARYQDNPDYENFKEMLLLPLSDAQASMSNRIPVPIYVECDQSTSQARFLVATVDPAITHQTQGVVNQGETTDLVSQIILTEDASLHVFMNKLFQLTCKAK